LAGKKEFVKDVMEFYSPNKDEEVRFIEEDTFRKIVEVTIQPEQKAMLWLCWDIGENISSILRLRKRDCVRKNNNDNHEVEYLINLRKEILKRSRRPRTEIANYKETVSFLDLILRNLDDDVLIFNFGHRQAQKILDRSVKITGAKCIPKGQKVTLKDLRSSMACHLLKEGWTTDEVNARLGHKPSSKEIDKYINFLALDKKKPKKKLHDNQITKLTAELEEMKSREKLYQQRQNHLQEDLDRLREESKLNNRKIFDYIQKMKSQKTA